ncbi:MAG: hypothetical protein ACI9AP_000674, partial [Flavobacteriales bacterium]
MQNISSPLTETASAAALSQESSNSQDQNSALGSAYNVIRR